MESRIKILREKRGLIQAILATVQILLERYAYSEIGGTFILI